MKTGKRTYLKIGALSLAVLLLICIVLVGMIAMPQLREKGKRYVEPTEFKNQGQVQLIAHRGLSGMEMENTLPAFEAAVKKEYYGIETDVQVTKDGDFIIAHDGDLSRIAGLDMTIANSTYAELRAIRFSDIYGGKTEKNLQLPSVEEYIEICKKYDKQAIVELKGDMTETKVSALAAKIEACGWLKRTTFISFSKENLLFARKASPETELQYVVEDCTAEDEAFMTEHKIHANLCWKEVTRARVKRLHKAGLKVNCWTVDGVACATLLSDYGVDMITTNILV